MSDAIQVAAAAGEQLVEKLAAAELATSGWGNQALADSLVDEAMTKCLQSLSATGLWGRDNQMPSAELWRIAGPLLERGRLQCEARLKPRGYAGDYVMLTRLCQREVCDDPLGAVFDRRFQREAAVEAVRAERNSWLIQSLPKHTLPVEGQTCTY